MNSHAWLRSATATLQSKGIETARLDALVLLEDCLATNRANILAHPEIELTSEQIHVLDAHTRRRSEHEPLAYIRGRTEFYGRNFVVDKNVLEPRPESETMIELLKKMCQSLPKFNSDTSIPSIIDIGTGSGALAITAKLEVPDSVVLAIDIDPSCVEIATRNAHNLQADVAFMTGDLLAPFGLGRQHKAVIEPVMLLCNLPYVPDSFHINQAATLEPRLAIFGGSDGLALYRRLFKQLKDVSWRPTHILTESLPAQHATLAGIALSYGYTCQADDDFIQVFVLTEPNSAAPHRQ